MKKLFSFCLVIAAVLLTLSPQMARAQVNEYLSVKGSATIYIKVTGTIAAADFPDLWYSTDKSNWTQITGATNWNTGNVTTYFKGNNPDGFNHSSSNYVSISITSGNPSLAGNIMSLIDDVNFATNNSTIPCDYCFYGLFCPSPPTSFTEGYSFASTGSTSSLYHAKDLVLPATNLKAYCYAYMFALQSSLYDAPALPATVMKPWCYAHMFDYCINNFCGQYSSATLPSLPAQQLAEGCYAYMFSRCGSIYNNDANNYYILPAEELAPKCYMGMFSLYGGISGGTSLKYLEIMATSLKDRRGDDITNSMAYMFNNAIWAGTSNGRQNLTIRMYWTDWGNSTTGPANNGAASTAPTYGWFYGNVRSGNKFEYQNGLNLTSKMTTNSTTTYNHTFPYNSTPTGSNYTYLTFDCKTNGGTWEADDDYNVDMRRVVRAGYTAKTVPANPHKLGCNFLGWYTAPSGGTKVDNATILSQTTAQNYYAQFVANDVDYTVTISNGAHGHVVVTKTNADPAVEYTTTSSVHNLSELTITAVPDAGYRFVGWTGEAATIKAAEDAGNTYYLIDDITVGATFEADECTVTIQTPASDGSLAASDGTNNYASGTTYTFNRQLDNGKVLTFTATPNSHRLFTGFTGTALSNVTATPYVYDQVVTGQYTITADTPDEVTVGATFVVPTFTVTTTITGKNGGYVALTADGYPDRTGSGTYDIDAVVTLTATPNNEMFKFVKWTDNDSENPVRTYTVLGDATFEAEFDLDGDLYSAPATVDVYASGRTNSTTTAIVATAYRILYNLDPVVGDDGITYRPVDMGTGLAWANKNLGAADSTKAGKYFYWGGTTAFGETGYTAVSTANYYTGISSMAANSVLPDEADAARQRMGANWRMPTYAETNLMVGTTTTAAGVNNSYTHTNKYYTDDKMLIPNAGRYTSNTVTKGIGGFWTSTLWSKNSTVTTSYPYVYYNDVTTNKTCSIYYAMPVRAVYIPPFETCTLTVVVYWASTLKYTYNFICEVGQTVTIKQHPSYTKYAFSAWRETNSSGTELSTDNSYTLTLTANRTIAAYYVSNSSASVLLTTASLPAKGGTTEGGGYYASGTNVTLTATPNENYRFVRWSEDGNTDNPRSYTTTAAAVTLTAEFEYTGTATSADANEEVFAYMPTNCFKVVYDYPASMTGNDGITYRLVDMGNGVLWANKNVGAADSTKAGSYFYWGGTTPVTTVGTATTWAGAQDMLLTTSYTTYSTLSPKVAQYALPADNDAATVKMGERWRMPTYEEVYYLSAPTGASETGAAASGYTYTNTLSGDKLFIPNSGYYKTNNSSTITTNHSLFWASTMGTYNATNSSCVAGYYYDGSATANSSTYGYIWYAMPVRGVYVPPFETCTIKVQISGGAVIAGNTSATTYYRYYICEKGQKLRLTAHPHSVGQTAWTYAFTNWTDVTNGSAVLSTDPTYEFIVLEDKEIKATFASTTSGFSTIYALPTPRSGGLVYGVGRYVNGVTTRLHAVPNEGYTFVKWEDNNSTNPYREITVDGHATYNAVFTTAVPAAASAHKYVNVWHEATTTTTETLYDGSPLETCTLTVKTYQSNSAKATYNFVCEKGQTVTVSAFTNTANYSLLHWTNADYRIFSYDPTVELVVTGDMTCYATFYTSRVTTRTLTLGSTPLEGATFDGAIKTTHLGVYEDGQVTKLICHPKPHYRFLYWDDDHSLTDTARIVTVTEDRTYTAVLEMDYDLTTVHSEDAFAQVYQGGTYQGTYLRYVLPGYDANGYRPVDIGVGIAWANKNVNATDSTDAGSYFYWGGTTPVTTAASGTYWTGVSSMTTTSANNVEQNPLPASNDAAAVIMKGQWRMPTAAELYNLQQHSGSSQTGQASAGYQWINKEDNTKSIFIPAGGYYTSASLTTSNTAIWGSTVGTIVTSNGTSRPTYWQNGSYSAGATTHYAWHAMPIRAVYQPVFETCSVTVIVKDGSTTKGTYIYVCEVGQRLTINGIATSNTSSKHAATWVDQNNVIVSTDQTYSLIALSNVTLTVTFNDTFTTARTLTFNVSPANSGTVNNVATYTARYNQGTQAMVSAKPAQYYKFAYWDDDHENTNPNRVLTVPNANTTYTAVFVKDEAQAVDARIAQAANADTTKILYPLPVLYKNSMFYTPVDMGTGTAWCDYNVGVTAPSSPNGSYFWWGATAAKTAYRYQSNTSYYYSGITSLTDGSELPTGADAAYSLLNSNWRIPSKEQWQALVDNCSTETENTFVNPGDASKTITLPQAGVYAPTTSSNASITSGVTGYWSRTLAVKNTSTVYASQPWCYSNGEVTYGDGIPNASGHGYVCYGMPIRAVYQPTFTPCTLTVRYTNDEEVTRTNTYLCQPGQPVRITAIPSEGYVFKKWNDNDTHAERTIFISEDMTFTAEFEEANAGSALIITQVNNAEWGSVTGGGEYDKGAAVTLTAQPEEHYHFVKWQLNDADIEGGATLNFTATAIATYKAFFAIDEHTLTTTATHGTVTGGGTYDYGTTGVTLTATADDHYHFVKWQLNGEDIPGEASLMVDVTADATYNAVFAIDRHTLSVTATHGTATGSGEYDYGTVVTLGVTPDEHYHFVSWSDDGAQSHSVTVTADAEYTATCSIDRFTLTVNGEHAVVTGAGEYDYNTQVTVTVSPDMGYNFVRWTDGETNPSRIVTMTENKTLAYETVYVPSYAITTVANGGVIYQTADRYEQQNGPTTYSYMNGTVLTLEVAASFGYAFTGWSDGNSDNPRVVTVTEAKTYTAQFSEQTNIVFHQTTGVLDFPTYAKNTFAIIGETDDVTFRLYFNTTLTTNKTDYLSNLSLDASQSYIQPTVGAKRTIASATVANVTYAGELFRAAHLTAMLTDTEGRTYDVDIYTNYCINYATFQEDYTYKYDNSYIPTESSWVNGRSFEYGEENYIGEMVIRPGNIMRYFLGSGGYDIYDYCQIQLQFYPDNTKTGTIPTGVYPINSTQAPGTVYIGAIPADRLTRQSNSVNGYAGTGSWVFHDMQNMSTYVRTIDNWVLRGGYVEVVNVDETYYVHVHAYTDGYKTLGEQSNTVIDFTAGGATASSLTPVGITIGARTAGGDALTDAVTAALSGASNWTDVEIGQGSHTFFQGNTLDLTASKPGYVFDHWEVNGATVSGEDYTYSYTVGASEANIVAVFELDTRPFYTIAVETGGRGTATLTADGYKAQTGSGYYAENTSVTMSVTPITGSAFLRWSDGNTQNPRVVTLTKDTTFTAVFSLESADRSVDVYQGAAADTMRILYNLDARTGDDGLTYRPVDMGYGVAWADRNVGANAPTNVGRYFYWGDTEGHTSFNAYQALNTSSYTSGTTLTPDLDAATQQIGTAWRMPTDDEWLDLRKNTTQSADHGTFMNKTFAGNTIYLPASGFYGTTYRNLYLYGDEGPWTSKLFTNYRFYWSSVYFVQNASNGLAFPYTFEDAEADANNYYYVNTNVTLNSTSYGFFDCFGMPVRAIYEPEYPTYTLTIIVGTKQYKYICQAGQNITVTANATAEGYVFDEWKMEDGTTTDETDPHLATRTFTMTGNITRTATFKEGQSTFTVTWKNADGTTLETDEQVEAGATPAYDGETPAKVSDETYYYTFVGWTDGVTDYAADEALPAVTGDVTYTARFQAYLRELLLLDSEDADYYDNIRLLNGQHFEQITYRRSVAYTKDDNGNARWYTLTLPFNADQSQLATNGLLRKVYEYRYAEGSADENDHVTFHFRAATSIIAGRGYLVKATSLMPTDYAFADVTLDTGKDTETDVNKLKFNPANAYKESGDIAIVGVLRHGTLSQDGRKVMGLANNKIWYPHTNGNPMPAYRAYFYNPNATKNIPRVRIVVEGEGETELEVVDGELYDAGGDRQAYCAPGNNVRKYMENGILIIERNGERFNAQGKRL
ncbi:MAG: InlB B-repeat-containing protein [Paludibacteraceae bacterium]|nr:InlB B-repeat-containing protein [Paludibacteraceae bacterium]